MPRPKGSKNKDTKEDVMMEVPTQETLEERAKDYIVEDTSYKGTMPVAPVSEETISMTKKELMELVDSRIETLKVQNDQLKEANKNLSAQSGAREWVEEEAMGKRKYFAHQSIFKLNSEDDEGLLIGWRLHETKTEPISGRILNQIYKIKCLYAGGEEKEHLVPYSQFSHMHGREKVEVIDIKRKRLSKIHGKVRRPNVDKEGYVRSVNMSSGSGDFNDKATGDWVPLKETVEEVTATIQRANGQTHTMPGKYLNC